MDLVAGDVLLSTAENETLTSINSLSVNDEDVFVFRPQSPGDYSAGTFIFLLDGLVMRPLQRRAFRWRGKRAEEGEIEVAAAEIDELTMTGVSLATPRRRSARARRSDC